MPFNVTFEKYIWPTLLSELQKSAAGFYDPMLSTHALLEIDNAWASLQGELEGLEAMPDSYVTHGQAEDAKLIFGRQYVECWETRLRERREELTRAMSEKLDPQLEHIVNKKKDEIRGALAKAILGRLPSLSSSGTGEVVEEVLKKLLQEFAAHKAGKGSQRNAKVVEEALDYLTEFNISFRGFFLHRLRKALAPLSPEYATPEFSSGANAPSRPMPTASPITEEHAGMLAWAIAEARGGLWKESVYRVRADIRSVLRQALLAREALGADVKDRLTSFTGAKEFWQTFCQFLHDTHGFADSLVADEATAGALDSTRDDLTGLLRAIQRAADACERSIDAAAKHEELEQGKLAREESNAPATNNKKLIPEGA